MKFDAEKNYYLEDFFFELPDELIAIHPTEKRDSSRLLILDRKSGEMRHSQFHELVSEIKQGDLLVFNNAKVIPARIYCNRESGAMVEVVLTQRLGDNTWLAICNRTKRLKSREKLTSVKAPQAVLTVIGRRDDFIEIETEKVFTDELLESIGEIPLPPYIKRKPENVDSERYQTVYAEQSGAAASPTAGLHFTKELLGQIKDKGAELEFLTLYVSWGTFQPVRENDLSLHNMHTESYELSEATAQRINKAREEGRRIIAVGTTSLRVLEATFDGTKNIFGRGETNIFIRPPYNVKSIDALITNFHTPYSTLLMLVSAFAKYDLIMRAYETAITEKYRFFSYGDAMFIV